MSQDNYIKNLLLIIYMLVFYKCCDVNTYYCNIPNVIVDDKHITYRFHMFEHD